jgi:hydrogenase maturation protein HypF
VLDATSALLGVCTKKTYDGEPAMQLESFAYGSPPLESLLNVVYEHRDGCAVLSTRSLLKSAYEAVCKGVFPPRIASSVQSALARGMAQIAIDAAHERGSKAVYLSGGVVYNAAIRSVLEDTITGAGLFYVYNPQYPLGDGCISYGQCVYASFSLQDGA